jgi:hypothetical protein
MLTVRLTYCHQTDSVTELHAFRTDAECAKFLNALAIQRKKEACERTGVIFENWMQNNTLTEKDLPYAKKGDFKRETYCAAVWKKFNQRVRNYKEVGWRLVRDHQDFPKLKVEIINH